MTYDGSGNGDSLANSDTPVKLASESPPADSILFLDLPSKTEEALRTFELLESCTYANRTLGESGQEEIMTCDCKESWDGTNNHACDEHSDCINRLTSIECVNNDCNCGNNCQNQRFQRREYANIDIIQTDMKGYGVRAMSFIRAGTFIYEYIGEVIDEGKFRRKMQQYDEDGIKHFYFMMLQKGEFVDATQKGCLARFCNHSCNPNCFVDKWVVKDKVRMGIFAKRDLLRGEEITFDYNVDRYGAQAQPCYCGEPNCIGYIGGKTQTEAAPKLSQALVDALGLSEDEDDWSVAVPKRKRKLKPTDDEEYATTLPTRPVQESGVSKIMSALVQSKEKWLVSKLLRRIDMSDDLAVQRRVMQMHGYQILGSILKEWKSEEDISVLVLEILSKWPRMTRNKISSSKIEGTVNDISTTATNERVQSLSKALLSEWQTLELAYRIPRRERPVASKSEKSEASTPAPKTNGGDVWATVGTKSYRSQPQRQNFYRMNTNSTPALPWGWASAEDPTGKTYYFNRAEGKTQWEFPEAELILPPPPPVSVAPTQPEKLDLQKIIDDANRVIAEKNKVETTKTGAETGTQKHVTKSSKSSSDGKHSDVSPEVKVTKLVSLPFAKYVPNIVARYESKIGHDAVKKHAKDITKILVEKELRPGHIPKSTSELSEDKKKKIKMFVTTYMDKIIKHKQEKDAKKGS
ncbi:uncharacterized protein V1518DRAFT_437715 [Limtongia smithiae]|uniref:uncharacterized protein n=1 Tax=Limtongia smithiae TaxID=1125753 RepID=UPI0034CD18B5